MKAPSSPEDRSGVVCASSRIDNVSRHQSPVVWRLNVTFSPDLRGQKVRLTGAERQALDARPQWRSWAREDEVAVTGRWLKQAFITPEAGPCLHAGSVAGLLRGTVDWKGTETLGSRIRRGLTESTELSRPSEGGNGV
ncbi:hypothetical protein NN561_001127 [Cricetulus griseus]